MPTVKVKFPTLHEGRDGKSGQVAAFKVYQEHRLMGLRAGRRWGKTDFDISIAADHVKDGMLVGWFAPDYKRLTEAQHSLVELLTPLKKSSSKVEGVFRAITGGRVDFWTLEDEDAGRSRKYHLTIIDEGAFTKPNMMDVWKRAIRPTLLDYRGRCIVSSNTSGIDPDNFFWRICNQPEHGFVQYHAPSSQNPYLPLDEIEALRKSEHPLVFQQEYEAEFVDWSGVAFFGKDKMLVNDQPVEWPEHCDAVLAVIDTAVKTGKDNDGTAVIYVAYNANNPAAHPIVILDWEIIQIEGALLETWLPTVFQNLESMAGTCKARRGSLGAFIEDKTSGSVLLQQARRREWPASEIESKLTSLGKDERAISVSGYVYRGLVKMSRLAYDKVTTYKGTTRNHLLAQVLGFRIGDKQAATRADDLLDTFCYAIAICLGNNDGF